jgi:hypothetical protein
MNIFAGKTPTERNKIIAATVLGIMALFSLYLAFGGGLFGGKKKTTVTASASPSPSPSATPNTANRGPIAAPDQEALIREWSSTPIEYVPGNFYAPDPGRNIFAFYEPPKPTPYSPTPTPMPTPIVIKPTPTPVPPPQFISFISPQNAYAGGKPFRLQVTGDKFTPETQIIFGGMPLPTTYVSANQLYADVPANLLLGEGPRPVMVSTPDGKLYSNQFLFNVQAPPRPQFEYYGIVARKRFNNDMAYIKERGKQEVTAARLNDTIEGRFKLVSISQRELVVEDVNLGFRHKVPLVAESPISTGSGPGSGGMNPYPQQPIYTPPINPNPNPAGVQQSIPGIPDDIPRANPTPRQPRISTEKKEDQGEDSEKGDG